MDSYKQALDFLLTRLPMFQRTGPAAYKGSLGNTLELDKLYGHPHRNFKSVHVAGTNGKGSVAHLLAAICQKAGYKTGLYTSPHLKDFRERIRVNGKVIDSAYIDSWVSHFIDKNRQLKLEPSFFELTVAMAFDYFSHENVEIAIIEVGLGGRLDSTNIITPEISVITNIGFDHINLLGDTLEKIAGEKAGIIKEGIPVVVGKKQAETEKVFNEKAKELNTTVFYAEEDYSAGYSLLSTDGKQVLNIRKNEELVYPDLKIGLLGLYQRENVITVLKTIELLNNKDWNFSMENIYEAMRNVDEITGLRGRWQVIGNNPLIVCDTGHNRDGIMAVNEQLKNTAFKKLHFVFGTVNDKNPEPVISLLPGNALYYFTQANIPRALDAFRLQKIAAGFGLKGEVYASVSEAFKAAKIAADPDDLIFVGGSTFVVAEVL